MEMTSAEIIARYKKAEQPMKQIGVLAELNACSRQEIVAILREAGCTLPKRYAPEAEKVEADCAGLVHATINEQKEEAPLPADIIPHPAYTIEQLSLAALATIERIVAADAEDDAVTKIRGIIQFITEFKA